MSDPWLVQKQNAKNEINGGTENGEEGEEPSELQFEDNFAPAAIQGSSNTVRSNRNGEHQPLPDSASYLLGLERKLQRIKQGTNLVEALTEKRQDCLRTLLQEDETVFRNGYNNLQNGLNNNATLELDAPLGGESAVQEIYRHLQPIQPLTVGELVHIVQHDQLEQRRQEEADELEHEDTSGDRASR